MLDLHRCRMEVRIRARVVEEVVVVDGSGATLRLVEVSEVDCDGSKEPWSL